MIPKLARYGHFLKQKKHLPASQIGDSSLIEPVDSQVTMEGVGLNPSLHDNVHCDPALINWPAVQSMYDPSGSSGTVHWTRIKQSWIQIRNNHQAQTQDILVFQIQLNASFSCKILRGSNIHMILP